ncbi:hypothetical protein [Actinotalea sp. K2]|uniref:hypothetical protein n=1 Tax=Actinotalea sp. K2 TaxID=2939438 RepID=UPI002017BD2C|nr:hypothetical protein [Actinotalea sp. K2]MCL3860322.1 hypothetical protein [Actinotalea sp. K2]
MEQPRPAAAAGGRRRPLSPGMTAFLAIDVILVVTFLVVLAMVMSGGDGDEPETPAASPTQQDPLESTPEESAPAEPTDSLDLGAFVLPSGNIHCTVTPDAATCTILQFSYEPPAPPEGCTGTVGSVLTVTATDGFSFPCVDAPPAAAPEGTPVLDYGQATTVGEMSCFSSTNGATCRHNPTGQGFSVARAGYQPF